MFPYKQKGILYKDRYYCSKFSFTKMLKWISSLALLATCSGVPVHLDSEFMKTFICNSSPDPVTQGNDDSGLAPRSFLLRQEKRWPEGIVPYELDSTFSPRQVEMIKEQLKMFSDVSCVRWVPRHKQKDFVNIVHSHKKSQCSSEVGRKGGMQSLFLGDDCFNIHNGYRGAIAHEMMHAIGFIHEQQRIDRDCFVRVAEEAAANIKFDYGITLNTETRFPYDFGSIMQYGSNDKINSLNGENLGNPQGKLTDMDKWKLNNMYCRGKTYCEVHPQNCLKFQEIQKKCSKNM